MSAKSKAGPGSADASRQKSVKKSSAVAGKRVAKAKTRVSAAGELPSIRTRTSLVGMKIYPASVEPSGRVKPILQDLPNKLPAA